MSLFEEGEKLELMAKKFTLVYMINYSRGNQYWAFVKVEKLCIGFALRNLKVENYEDIVFTYFVLCQLSHDLI